MFIVLAISVGAAGLVWGISGFTMSLDFVLAWVISLWLAGLVLGRRFVWPFVQVARDLLLPRAGDDIDDDDA